MESELERALIEAGEARTALSDVVSKRVDINTFQEEVDMWRRQLAEDERRRNALMWISVTMVCLTALLFFAPRLWSPFTYTDHGTVISEYCPGDDMVLRFSGWSDGIPRTITVTGHLQNTETGKRYPYDPVQFSRANWSLPTKTIDFIYRDRVIPRIPAGAYIYVHANSAGSGRVSQITFDGIEIKDCE